MFQMVGTYFQSVGSFAMSADPPVGITLWCVGYAMENVIPYFIENKEHVEKAKMFIDVNFPTLSLLWDVCKHGINEKDEKDPINSPDSKYTYIRGANNIVSLTLTAGQSIHIKCFKVNTLLLDYDVLFDGDGYCTQTVYDIRDGSLIHSSNGNQPIWEGGFLWNTTIPEVDLKVHSGSVYVSLGTTYGTIGYYVTGCPAFPDGTEPTEETNYKSKKYTYNGHDYQFVNYAASYEDAKQWCENNGGHLVAVSSKDENDFVAKIVSENNSTHIATDTKIENENQSQYISISNEGTWMKEDSVDVPLSFICEWDYTYSYQVGDVDLDGTINIKDATSIQMHIADLFEFTDEQLTLADTDCDGEVNIKDATKLQMYIAGYSVVLGES